MTTSLPFIAPVHYFNIAFDCRYLSSKEWEECGGVLKKSHRIPDTSFLCQEAVHADVFMGWNESELAFYISTYGPCLEVHYPDITYGDSAEFFIDTRDNKEAGFSNRFCHHFFALPKKPDNGPQAAEMTHFRTEEGHELCPPELLFVKARLSAKKTELILKIPAEVIHGYEPQEYSKLGFSYRINRYREFPQHFSVCSDEFTIDQQPSLWGTARLIK